MKIKGLEIEGVKLTTTTNILDIHVPEELKTRIPTTVEWFDEAINGGFLPTQACMLTGDPGAGKTTFTLQMADAITASGNICLYNTREEALTQVRLKIEQLGLTHGFVAAQHIFTDELFNQANDLKKKFPKKHVIIVQDSLPALDDGYYRGKPGSANANRSVINGSTPIRAMTKLTEWAKQEKGTVVCINHVTKGGQFAGKQAVKHVIDTHIEIELAKDNSRTMYVSKNRFGSTSARYIIGMGQKGLELLSKIDRSQGLGESSQADEELAAAENINLEGKKPRRKRRHNLRAV